MTMLIAHPKSKKAKKETPWLEDGKTPQYHPPKFTSFELYDIRQVAILHAQANPSDPFAYARIKKDMERGLVFRSDVRETAQNVINSRGGKRVAGAPFQ